MYQLLHGYLGQPATCVRRVDGDVFIPLDPANTDYQEYLKWLEAGNTPLPADPQEAI